MHWIDVVIVAVIAWSAFSAFRRGLIREVVSLLSVLLGGIVAGHLYGRLAGNIDFLIGNAQMRDLVSFIAIFAGFVILGQIAATLLRTTAGLLLLGPIDHFGGALFGFVQGLVFVEFLLFALAAFPAIGSVESTLHDSTLAPVFLRQLPLFERLLPSEFQSAIGGFQGAALQSVFPNLLRRANEAGLGVAQQPAEP
jgi:uncharacterized membrane protein required for colicin V production